MRTLRQAWEAALYGPGGRFTSGRRDFATALTDPVTAPALCAALLERALETDRALGEPADFTLVDVGAGTGAFLSHAARRGPSRWRLLGVERCPRPAGLDPRIAWAAGVPEHRGFLLGHEWLDDVPCDLVTGGRTVLADGTLGPEHDPTWLERWWPPAASNPGTPDAAGAPVEDGSARDEAWLAVTARLTAGRALAIDYGHTSASRRPTLTGWRGGRPVPPVFDGSCDVTAHVALDSLAGTLTRQRDALAGVEPADSTTTEGLGAASALRALRDPDGRGSYGWVTLDRL